MQSIIWGTVVKIISLWKILRGIKCQIVQDKNGRAEGDDDLQRNLPKTTSELEEEPKKSRERNSDLQQEVEFLRLQQVTSTPLPSPSPPVASAGSPHSQRDLQGGQDHPTTLHRTNADLRDEENHGALNVRELRMELQTQKKLLKKVKDEAELELAASLRREEAALREKEAALRREEAALREKEAALRREADAVEEERKKFLAVISQIKEGNTLPTKPLNRNTPGVKKFGPNVLSENTTINNCRTNVTIHKEIEAFLEALFGDQTKLGKLYQKTVEKDIFYWSFMVNNTKSCDLLLRMRVVRQDEDGVEVRVESVEEEELEATSLPNPHSTATKKVQLLLKEGMIILQPLPFGQTSFTFMAQVDVGEVTKDAIIASTSSSRKSTTSKTRSTTAGSISSAVIGATSRTDGAMKMVGVVAEAAKASELFSKLADLFYDRFKKEEEIDERRKADFIENGIPNAPPLTGDEQKMIEESMELVKDVASRGKRIAC
ncbi:hypothetical protein TrST_g12581 [Triparma strigata]|uniref:Uncharacterized protein n=1 Tax=Triparma strigata TaxID=1606541 RepID=A0A9W7ELQ4_9STRA|nr:hypothetical protein TrST_g12581 [Triparma strigata]